MKDETAGFTIKEFVEFTPKLYSFLLDDNKEHKKANEYMEMLLRQLVIPNIKIYC